MAAIDILSMLRQAHTCNTILLQKTKDLTLLQWTD